MNGHDPVFRPPFPFVEEWDRVRVQIDTFGPTSSKWGVLQPSPFIFSHQRFPHPPPIPPVMPPPSRATIHDPRLRPDLSPLNHSISMTQDHTSSALPMANTESQEELMEPYYRYEVSEEWSARLLNGFQKYQQSTYRRLFRVSHV